LFSDEFKFNGTLLLNSTSAVIILLDVSLFSNTLCIVLLIMDDNSFIKSFGESEVDVSGVILALLVVLSLLVVVVVGAIVLISCLHIGQVACRVNQFNKFLLLKV